MLLSTNDLRSLLALAEERDVCLARIADIDESFRKILSESNLSVMETRVKRRSMTEMVLPAIERGGSAGVSVGELAKKLKVTRRNIHAWLNTTGKRNELVEPIGRGVYRAVRRRH